MRGSTASSACTCGLGSSSCAGVGAGRGSTVCLCQRDPEHAGSRAAATACMTQVDSRQQLPPALGPPGPCTTPAVHKLPLVAEARCCGRAPPASQAPQPARCQQPAAGLLPAGKRLPGTPYTFTHLDGARVDADGEQQAAVGRQACAAHGRHKGGQHVVAALQLRLAQLRRQLQDDVQRGAVQHGDEAVLRVGCVAEWVGRGRGSASFAESGAAGWAAVSGARHHSITASRRSRRRPLLSP
jgi:hypothetical protein